MKTILFYLGIGLFFTHELDAMVNNEWRVLPLTSWLPQKYGQLVFVLAHIPLFGTLVFLLASQQQHIRERTQIGLAIFWLIHGLLHAAFSNHNHYEFNSMLSNSLIYGGAICGVAYLSLRKLV